MWYWLYHWFAQLHRAAAEHGHTRKPAGVVGIYLQAPGYVTTHIRLQTKLLLYCQVPSLGSSPSSFSLKWPFSEVSLMFDCRVCRTLVVLVTYAPSSGWWRLARSHEWRTHCYLCWWIQSHSHMKMHKNIHSYFPRSQAKTLQSFFAHPCYWEQSQFLRVQEACSESVAELNKLNGWLILM